MRNSVIKPYRSLNIIQMAVEWRTRSETALLKSKTEYVLGIIFWNLLSIVHVQFLYEWRTINAVDCSESFAQSKARRRDVLFGSAMFFFFSARQDLTQLVQQKKN